MAPADFTGTVLYIGRKDHPADERMLVMPARNVDFAITAEALANGDLSAVHRLRRA